MVNDGCCLRSDREDEFLFSEGVVMINIDLSVAIKIRAVGWDDALNLFWSE